MRTFLRQTGCGRRGFTLVEVLITILVGMIIMAAVTGVFISHTRTYTMHDDISLTQQNLRGALMLLPSEIRMAGCDPLQERKAEILTATPTSFEFTADLGGDKKYPLEADGKVDGANERVWYVFCEDTQDCRNVQSNGGCGGKRETPGRGVLCRKAMPPSGKWADERFREVAGDIERMEFSYILQKRNRFEHKNTLGRDDFGHLAAVQISLLARGEFEDPKYNYDGEGFTAASGTSWKISDIYTDEARLAKERHHRRRIAITTVKLRNKGE